MGDFNCAAAARTFSRSPSTCSFCRLSSTCRNRSESDSAGLSPDAEQLLSLEQVQWAELIEDEAHAQLRLVHAMAQKSVAVGAYLADAKAGPDGPEPTHFREVFRTRGPSNYPHGKQAELI